MVFAFGGRVAVVPASGSVLYYAEDLLGSSRVIVQSNGTLCYDADFTPFGGEKSYISTCPQNYKFEGKERDTETGNDDFGARYYSWRFGRWLSSDWSAVPVAVPYANLNNPQTLNLYAMVADDPESFADLDGHVGGNTGITSASCGNTAPGMVECVADLGGGRLGMRKGDVEMGDQPPTVLAELRTESEEAALGEQRLAAQRAQTPNFDANYTPRGGNETLGATAGMVGAETLSMTDTKKENMTLADAQKLLAHQRFNAERAYGDKIDALAGMMKGLTSGSAYNTALIAVIAAAREDFRGFDPTHGATNYNMRTPREFKTMRQKAPSWLHHMRVYTHSGPYGSWKGPQFIMTYGAAK